jgi:hypothetical protein
LANYYSYRVSTRYDGFVPALISDAFRLDGDVSRRLYKNRELTAEQFRHDYLKALVIRRTNRLCTSIRAREGILLLDDVYTDGITRTTVAEGLTREFPDHQLRITVATLGIMAKHKNMDRDLAKSWR